MESGDINLAKQEQIHDILFGKELGWQEIIYDLINSEELNPWDINITILSEKFLEKIESMGEGNFFVSSKVLLAASLLLRIKSEILLNKYIKSIDEILFGKSEKKKYQLERIELDESIPELIPRSPMPRYKKVTLKELVESLNKAINTENRRIKRTILNKNALRESSISLPKKTFNLKDKIHDVLGKISDYFTINTTHKKIPFKHLHQDNKDHKINHFTSLLHLENQNKIWLEQPIHFEEIHVWRKKTYFKENGNPYEELGEEE